MFLRIVAVAEMHAVWMHLISSQNMSHFCSEVIFVDGMFIKHFILHVMMKTRSYSMGTV